MRANPFIKQIDEQALELCSLLREKPKNFIDKFRPSATGASN
jgi:hypothetical protein